MALYFETHSSNIYMAMNCFISCCDNGLLPLRHLFKSMMTYFQWGSNEQELIENCIKTKYFSFQKMYLEMLSAKYSPFYSGLKFMRNFLSKPTWLFLTHVCFLLALKVLQKTFKTLSNILYFVIWSEKSYSKSLRSQENIMQTCPIL